MTKGDFLFTKHSIDSLPSTRKVWAQNGPKNFSPSAPMSELGFENEQGAGPWNYLQQGGDSWVVPFEETPPRVGKPEKSSFWKVLAGKGCVRSKRGYLIGAKWWWSIWASRCSIRNDDARVEIARELSANRQVVVVDKSGSKAANHHEWMKFFSTLPPTLPTIMVQWKMGCLFKHGHFPLPWWCYCI